MSEAKIGVLLAGAAEALRQLQEIEAAIDRIQSKSSGRMFSGSGPGAASGTGATAPGAVSSPGVGPTMLSQAASVAGTNQIASALPMQQVGGFTFAPAPGGGFASVVFDPIAGRWADPSRGTYYLGGISPFTGKPVGSPSPATPVPVPAPPQTPGIMAGLQQILPQVTAAMAFSESVTSISQLVGNRAAAAASGNPYYAFQDMPTMLNLGTMGVGAGLGFALGGPMGAALGAGAGMSIGQIVQSAIMPGIQRRVSNLELSGAYASGFGGGSLSLSSQVADAGMDVLRSGRVLPVGLLQFIDRTSGSNRGQGERMVRSLSRLAYNPSVLRNMGMPNLNMDSIGDEAGRDLVLQMARQALFDDPEVAFQASLDFGVEHGVTPRRAATAPAHLRRERYEIGDGLYGVNLVDDRMREMGQRALRVMHRRSELRAVSEANQAQEALVGSQMSSRAENSLPQYRAVVAARRSILTEELGIARDSGNGAAVDRLQAEIGLLDQVSRNTETDIAMERIAAIVGSRGLQAMAGFERMDFSGRSVSASQLFGGRESEVRQRRSDILRMRELERERAGGQLGQARELAFQDQLLAADMDQMRLGFERDAFTYDMARGGAGLRRAQGLGGMATRSAFGTPTDRAQSAGVELEYAREMLRIDQERLRVVEQRGGISQREVLALREQVAMGRVTVEQARRQAILAVSEANRFEPGVQSALASISADMLNLQGVGGQEAVRARLDVVDARSSQLNQLRANRQSLIDQGFSPMSQEVRGMDVEIASMARDLEQYRAQELATVPTSSRERVEMAQRAFAIQAMMAGYGGSDGAMRSTLRAQMESLQGLNSRDEANRSRMMASGEWTDLMEERYQAVRLERGGSLLQLNQAYDSGWEERMISMSFGMNTTAGRELMARYTRREASLAGVVNRAFGGTEEQTREFRLRGPARIMDVMGADSSAGFTERATARTTVEIQLSPEAARALRVNYIGDGQRATEGFRTARDLDSNQDVERRPGG